jgi:EmrB/QacA subfamily drug resistance transporter
MLSSLQARRRRFLDDLDCRGVYPRWVLVAALGGMFATTFPVTILTVSLGAIAGELGASESTMTWVISAPILLSAVALPLLGKLGDLHGHRRVFLTGFTGAAATAFLTAYAWDAPSLIAFRILSAVLGAATQPSAMALIFSVYGRVERSRAMGWWSMTGAAAPALGLIAGGPLVDALGWRVVFVIQGFLACIALAVAALLLRETQPKRVRFDVAGSLSLALGVGALMLALGRLRQDGLSSPLVLSATAIGLLGLASFVAIERRTPEPLLSLDYFRRRNFSAPIVANAFMGAAYMGAFVLAPLVLLELYGFTVTTAALFMLLRTVTLTFSSVAGGHLAGRLGERPTALLGTTILTAGLATLAFGVQTGSLAPLGIGLLLQGLGNGVALPSLTTAIAGSVPTEDLGIASAANRLTAQVGTAFGITLFTLAYGGVNTPAALARPFWLGTALAAAAIASASTMDRHPAAEAPAARSRD